MLRAVLVRQRAVSGLSEQDGGLVSLEEIEHQRQRISTNTWAVVMFIAYLILGLLVNCFGEEMNALDSVYLSIITLTTIGYGKAERLTLPITLWAFIFCLPYCSLPPLLFLAHEAVCSASL